MKSIRDIRMKIWEQEQLRKGDGRTDHDTPDEPDRHKVELYLSPVRQQLKTERREKDVETIEYIESQISSNAW